MESTKRVEMVALLQIAGIWICELYAGPPHDAIFAERCSLPKRGFINNQLVTQ
jgi:hypothetical protein